MDCLTKHPPTRPPVGAIPGRVPASPACAQFAANPQFSGLLPDAFSKLITKGYDRHHEKWL
jgi:hypothetical protein